MTTIHRLLALGAIGALTIVNLLVGAFVPLSAEAESGTCYDVEAIWARGSGQGLNASEYTRFNDELMRRVKSPTLLKVVQLGAGNGTGFSYPAVPVGGDHLINTGGAKLSGGEAFAYGDSVDAGANEASVYITQRLSACPNTKFILGGYSQGAQVIGETYNDRLNDSKRSAVVFNMLFGDPKLHLPEGEGFNPPACRGQELSPWRRHVPNCDTDNGSLGARKPYLPSAWEDDTGLWCNNDDFVCGSSKFAWKVDGHMTYGNEEGAIYAGVQEAVSRLEAVLTAEKRNTSGLDTSIHLLKGGTKGLDVLFVIDSTGSMEPFIDQAKTTASALSRFVSAVNGRVALVEYRDEGDEFTARVLSNLSDDTAGFYNALGNITVDGGGDSPEALLHALKTGMNGVDWRPGATKAAIVLTDASYHDPDYVDGSTLDEIKALSLSIDPVNVYPVVPDYLVDEYASLAEATVGQVVPIGDDAAEALNEALTRIESRPIAQLALGSYRAEPGQTIHFDGSSSYSVGSTISTWDWDFDGDGSFEILGGSPQADHTYPEPFSGVAQLRITDANGLVASMSVPVEIGSQTPTGPAPADTLSASGTGSDITLEWTAPESPSKSWLVSVNGIPVGAVGSDQRTAELTDIERSETVEFGVSPVTADGEVGAMRVTYLEPEDASPSTAPAPSSDTVTPSPSASPSSSATVEQTPARSSSPSHRPDQSIPVTGVDVLPIGVGALVLLGIGAILIVIRRKRN